MPELSRRDFLKLARDGFLYLSGALTLGGLLHFLDYNPGPAQKTAFDLGPASNYPFGSRTSLPEIPAFLIHSDKGFTALSLVCTHLGCTVASDAKGFACACHGSSYDADGQVMHGPAVLPLRSLRIEITEDNQLILHTD